jgi:hypothetical protein
MLCPHRGWTHRPWRIRSRSTTTPSGFLSDPKVSTQTWRHGAQRQQWWAPSHERNWRAGLASRIA